jgi:hypothetical protein
MGYPLRVDNEYAMEPEDVWSRVEANERIARQYLTDREPDTRLPNLAMPFLIINLTT